MTAEERDVIARAPFTFTLGEHTHRLFALTRDMERAGLVMRTVVEGDAIGQPTRVTVYATMLGAQSFAAENRR